MTYRSNLLPQLKEAQEGKRMNEILPGLYVGNLKDSRDARLLDMHGITHILSIYDEAKKLFRDKKYLIISAADNPRQDIVQFVPQCNDFIHAARIRGGHVLVHCFAGVSRSVTVAAAYILSVTNLNHQEALQAVRSARVMANPNEGFLRQMAEFQQSGLEKERLRLSEKFRPRSAMSETKNHRPKSGNNNKNGNAASAVTAAAAAASGSPIAGRITLKMATTNSPAADNLVLPMVTKHSHGVANKEIQSN